MLNNQRVFLVIDSPVMVDFPFPKWPKQFFNIHMIRPSSERLDLLGVANLPLPRHIVVVEGNGVDQGGSLYRSGGTWCSYGN